MRKLIHMSLIIIITVMAALFLFAPAKTYSVNKKLPFKAKKYCMTAILAQPLRAALDATKIGKLIPLYCSCGKSSNTVDSSLTWMNEKGTFNIAMNSKTQSELEKNRGSYSTYSGWDHVIPWHNQELICCHEGYRLMALDAQSGEKMADMPYEPGIAVCGCDFRDSHVPESLKEMLRQNGALI